MKREHANKNSIMLFLLSAGVEDSWLLATFMHFHSNCWKLQSSTRRTNCNIYKATFVHASTDSSGNKVLKRKYLGVRAESCTLNVAERLRLILCSSNLSVYETESTIATVVRRVISHIVTNVFLILLYCEWVSRLTKWQKVLILFRHFWVLDSAQFWKFQPVHI